MNGARLTVFAASANRLAVAVWESRNCRVGHGVSTPAFIFMHQQQQRLITVVNNNAHPISSRLSSGKDRALALSLHGRTKPGKFESTPAPGDYDPQKAEKIIQDSSPKYSFGIKPHAEKLSTTPGKQPPRYPQFQAVHLHFFPFFSLSFERK